MQEKTSKSHASKNHLCKSWIELVQYIWKVQSC